MIRKSVCRFCESHHSFSLRRGGAGSGFYSVAGAQVHYAPDQPFRLKHIRLELKVLPQERVLTGTVTQRLQTIAPAQKRVRLDQVGLKIQQVRVNSQEQGYQVQGDHLWIDLGLIPEVGSEVEISIQYEVRNPKRGIYFTAPDEAYPQKPYQVWTQGQDEDSRYWFPTLDYPNQKATSEILAHVPHGFTAVSNGQLVSQKKDSLGTEFHYRLGTPHVTYLISLVVAEFSKWEDTGPQGLPVEYFVQPGREEDGRRAFGHTPKMIEVFELKTGVSYPFEKYSQVAVQDFIFGGMENTSATTQTDLTLHDARAHLDFTSDPLVSHELAHQWFGDLVTCRDWSHGWLNEGFATFMERVWVENRPGPDGGWSEAQYYSYQDLKEYFQEDQTRYRRPIVCNTYIEPIDLFDTHLYQKGGLVLNLLRSLLGEDQFWRCIRFYLEQNRGKSVETLDLIRAIEEVSGRNLRRFFDEWVFQAGYPEFEISYQWHAEKNLAEWVIEQKQTQGKSFLEKDGTITPVFHLPVVLEMTLKSGEVVRHHVELTESRERFFLSVATQPVMVRFDPHFNIPKKMKFPRPKELLLHQLVHDTDAMGRIEAAQELSKIADDSVVSALAHSLLHDPFWGVQVEVAEVLAGLATPKAQEALLAGLSLSSHRARRGVVRALGQFRNEKVTQALRDRLNGDPSYFVEAEAIQSYVSTTLSPRKVMSESGWSDLEQLLIQQLNKPSYREVIRSAALQGLSDLPGMGEGRFPQAFHQLIEWSQRGYALDARLSAIRGLGKILTRAARPQKDEILRVMNHLSHEDHFRVRMVLVATLESSSCVEAIPILEKIRFLDSDGRVRRGAQVAMTHLQLSGELPLGVTQLRQSLEKLEEDYQKLRLKVEELQGVHGANS